MIALSCNNLNKSFGIDLILENINFTLNEGDKVGLVGINGSGKTTLFKILTNQYGYDSGDIYLGKNINVGYLEQNTNFESNNTLYEEVLLEFKDIIEMENNLRELEIQISKESSLGESKQLTNIMDIYSNKLDEFAKLNGYGYKSEAKGILKGLGFSEEDMNKKINVLSGGEKTRVLLSKLLLKKPDLILLDEPTNHLDTDAIEWLEAFLKQYNKSFIIISHDRYFLDQVTTRTFELHNRKLKTYDGNYSEFIKKSKIEKELELKKYEDNIKDIKQQEESIERLKAFGREKHLKRARSKEKALNKIETFDKPDMYRKKANIRFQPSVISGKDVLHVDNLSCGYDNNALFKNANFDIYRGDKIALIGPNGIGKSTLFNTIMKKHSPLNGSFKLGSNVNIGYYDQQQKTLNLDKSVIDEIWDENINLNQTQIRTLLGAFLFEDEQVFKDMKSLSGGERARVALLKLILSESNLLLLDEPTNHLDIDSKEVLEDALSNYEGTLFMISHDRYFLNTVADKILVLSEDGVKLYLGNYDYYIEKKKQISEMNIPIESEEKTKTQIKEDKRKEKEKKDDLKKIRIQREKIEKEIMSLEEEIENLNNMLCMEEIYSNPEKSKEIHTNKSNLENNLEMLYEKWEEFE